MDCLDGRRTLDLCRSRGLSPAVPPYLSDASSCTLSPGLLDPPALATRCRTVSVTAQALCAARKTDTDALAKLGSSAQSQLGVGSWGPMPAVT
jgi:hypothetical protein